MVLWNGRVMVVTGQDVLAAPAIGAAEKATMQDWAEHPVENALTAGVELVGDVAAAVIDVPSQSACPESLGRLVASAAKIEAFLNVPLYQTLHDRHNGGLLPGDSGIEEEMIKLGVTRKSAGRARQAFQRSAEYAGFFGQGRNRLVVPPLDKDPDLEMKADESKEGDKEVAVRSKRPSGEATAHPLLEGLWASLPPQGEAFSPEQQSDWIQMAELALKMVYGGTRYDENPC